MSWATIIVSDEAVPKPGKPGSYALLFYLPSEAQLDIGKLGRFSFASGCYLYLGSAMGGLKARLGRHLADPRCLHWHVDYLAARSRLLEVWWKASEDRLECAWASQAAGYPGASCPVPGFGSSDCRCASHLVWFAERPSPAVLGTEGVSILKLDGSFPP